jgi:hypothetical protein
MKQVSIYNALGLAETASDREVRHALRQTLRENYKKARDNFGVLEDSLRFYNQASQILNDKDRRKLYDSEWSLSNASEEQRIDFILRQAAEGKLAPSLAVNLPDVDETAAVRLVTSLGDIPKPVSNLELVPEHADLGFQIPPPRLASTLPSVAASSPGNREPDMEKMPEGMIDTSLLVTKSGTENNKSVPSPPVTQHYHPILTENVGYSRSLIFQGFSAGLTALLIGALFYVAWEHIVEPFEVAQSWIWTVGLLLMVLLYSIGLRQGRRRREKDFELSGSPDEEAIKGWRRKQTVFLGSNFLAEDPSWVFQLRLTELERGRIGRTSYPRFWRRALARLFDYALWGWLLFFPLYESARLGIIPQSLFQYFSNLLLVPVLITFTWIPVEALLMAAVGTTLGKWLFGIYVQFRVSTPYAPRGGGDCWRYALQRAFRVWWQGMAMGIAPLTPIAAARARAGAERFDETDWDEKDDVLVTHTPISIIPGLVGGLGLAVLLFMYIAAWQQPLIEAGEEAKRWVIQQIEPGTEVATSPSVLPGVQLAGNEAADDHEKMALTPLPVDPEAAEGLRKLEEFREAIVRIREESLLLLDRKDWKRAHESCLNWARLEVTNPAPRRCQGTALQEMGRHQEAINAFRSAKVYAAPEDRSLDEAIAHSQEEIFKGLNR